MASAAGGTAAVVAPEARPGSTVVEKFQDDAIYQDIVTHAVQDGEDADKSDTQIADSEPESQQSTLCESGQDQQEPLSQDARSLHELEARSLPYSNTLNDLWPGVWPRRVVALRDFEVRPAGGYIFDVKEGDDFEITRLLPGDWYEARIRGKICRIPSLYVRIMNPEDSSSLASFEKTLNEAAKAVQTATRYLDAQSNAKQPPDPAILQRVEDLGRARAKAKIASVDYALLQHAHGTATTVQRVRALYDFTPSELGELAFQKNDTIAVLGSVYKDWWKGYRKGQTGIFPLNYVEAYEGTQIELECDGSTDCGSARCPWLHQGEVLKPPLQRTDSLQPPSVSQKPATVSADPAAATETKQSELSDKSGLTITVDHAVGNVNYGPKTRMELRSRSVLPYQARENRQKTPPIPSPPPKAASPQLKQPTGERVHRDRQLEVREGLFDAGKGELFYTLTRRENSEMPKTSVLNIATLQHMALHQIQYDIACYVKYMYQTSQFWMQVGKFPPLTALLHDYCEAIRNVDFMTQCALRGYETDPFLMKTSRALERRTMESVDLVPNHVLPSGPLPQPQDKECPQLREMGRNEANKAAYEKKRVLRFSMAALGGLLLVVPTVIMATVPGLRSSLVTTCISIIVFAVLISWRTELGPNEVLATTAAYAAVLVVFVGTSLTRPQPGR